MKEKSAEECIKRILRDIEKRKNIDYNDYDQRNVVRRNNAAMDRIWDNSFYLCEHYPEQMDLFLELVNSPDPVVSCTCAHILYRVPNATIDHKKLAVSVLKKLVDHPGLNPLVQFGTSANVSRWEAELAELDKQSKAD